MGDLNKKFQKTYKKHIEKIYRFIFLKVNSQETAEDLCSNTFVRYFKALKANQNIRNPKAFLYQIARNLVTDHYRKKGKVKLISTESDPSLAQRVKDPRLNSKQEAEIQSEIKTLRKALLQIREDWQDVIVWKYVERLSTREIAGILDKSEGAVRVTVHRAQKALKQELNKLKQQE